MQLHSSRIFQNIYCTTVFMLTHPVGAILVSHWTYLYWFPFAESGKHQKNRLCLLCSSLSPPIAFKLPCIQVQCRTDNIYHFTDIESRPFCPTSLQDIKFYRSAAEQSMYIEKIEKRIYLYTFPLSRLEDSTYERWLRTSALTHWYEAH